MDNSVVSELDENNNDRPLSSKEKVTRAETIQAIKVVNSNYSFASTDDDSDRFRNMFLDSVIAKNYQQCRTKVGYNINMVYPRM